MQDRCVALSKIAVVELIDRELPATQLDKPGVNDPDLIEVLVSLAGAVSSSADNRHQHQRATSASGALLEKETGHERRHPGCTNGDKQTRPRVVKA